MEKIFHSTVQFQTAIDITLRKFPSPTLSNLACRNELKALQERYVITVVDKASGNYAFTCRKFYFLKLAEELGLNNATPGNDTYRFCPEDEQAVCDRLKPILAKFRITPRITSIK